MSAPQSAQAAVFAASAAVPEDTPLVKGVDFGRGQVTLDELVGALSTTGFQATELGRAIDVVNSMISWRLSDEPASEDEVAADLEAREEMPEQRDARRKATRCKVFLGYTSNLVSSGVRDVIRYLVQCGHVDVLVTTAGGVEEDLIKCLAPTYVAKFNLDGSELRKKGMNRIGNLIVPNDNYTSFEDWVMPILEKMASEQRLPGSSGKKPHEEDDEDLLVWTPSKVCERLGHEINNETSILYWAAKKGVPVFCPALTDGSLGDMLYFHSYKSVRPIVVDLVRDIRRLNDLSVQAPHAGIIILGGGVCKHQIANSMLFRNGADYAVYINTGQEFDGSDSGARPDEAISWGKIKSAERGGVSIKVSCDATLAFPLLVAGTFAKINPAA